MKKNQFSKHGVADYLREHPHPRSIIVCESRKFIYMKATKTAGTSILRGFLEKNIEGIIHEKDTPIEFKLWLDNVTDSDLEYYYIFSVVRNPFDRIVSMAAYFDIEPEDYFLNIKEYQKQDKVKTHSLPLNIYTHCNGMQFVDEICRFENLQHDFNIVCENIGLEKRTLPFNNKSNRGDYKSYFNDESKLLISKIYEEDIKLFKYEY